ncbi:MAG: hypothetical protein KAR20_27490, partial [Candidatus Heimdallarchaeota archaeon]|nr:hypothetical protein [Candidatus Heimdallarchaeota archaeon]
KDFWVQKNLTIEKIPTESLRIFSAYLTDIVIDFLQDNNALLSSSAVNVNGKLLRNLVIFELNEDNNRNISIGIIDKLTRIWRIFIRLNKEKIHAQKITSVELKKFKSSNWLYDFVLNHIIVEKGLLNSAQNLAIFIDDSEKLINQLLTDSPISIFALSGTNIIDLVFPEPDIKTARTIVKEVFEMSKRLPFFYEYLIESWLKFEFSMGFIKNAEKFSKNLLVFSDLLGVFVEKALKQNELTHLLELPIRFYDTFFENTEKNEWFNVRKKILGEIFRKSEQSDFIARQIEFFAPLDSIIEHLTEIKQTSMIEHTDFDSYLNRLPVSNISKLTQNVEVFKHKLNRLLTG